MPDVLQYLDAIDKLPPMALLAVFTLVFGYALRRADWISNQRIPLFLFIFGAMGYPLMTWGYMPFILKGAIVSGGVWLFHKIVLKRLEDKFPSLKKVLTGEVGEVTNTEVVISSKTVKTDEEHALSVSVTEQPKPTPEAAEKKDNDK